MTKITTALILFVSSAGALAASPEATAKLAASCCSAFAACCGISLPCCG